VEGGVINCRSRKDRRRVVGLRLTVNSLGLNKEKGQDYVLGDISTGGSSWKSGKIGGDLLVIKRHAVVRIRGRGRSGRL